MKSGLCLFYLSQHFHDRKFDILVVFNAKKLKLLYLFAYLKPEKEQLQFHQESMVLFFT